MPQSPSAPINLAKYALSIALICIAASLAYFSYNMLKVVEQLPKVLASLSESTEKIEPLTDDIKRITDLVPGILEEVEQVRVQIPSIVKEVGEIRTALPSVIEEVKLVRTAIPPIIEEVALVRKQIPSIVAELNAYQKVISDTLAEVEKTRTMIPPTLDRLDILVDNASVAGQKASEGAVTGIVSGAIKMPFKMIGNLGNKVFFGEHITKTETEDVIQLAKQLAETGKDGDSYQWKSKNKDIRITITITDTQKPSKTLAQKHYQKCRTLRVIAHNKNNKTPGQNIFTCKNKSGDWEEIANK